MTTPAKPASDTPRTDARTYSIVLAHDILWQDMSGDSQVDSDFARQLELENTELREALSNCESMMRQTTNNVKSMAGFIFWETTLEAAQYILARTAQGKEQG